MERSCWYIIHMKAVQVMFDERLLARLDATPEVRRDGRSAVLRRAVEHYLDRRRRWAISEGYRAAYGEGSTAAPVADELDGWAEQGAWPDE